MYSSRYSCVFHFYFCNDSGMVKDIQYLPIFGGDIEDGVSPGHHKWLNFEVICEISEGCLASISLLDKRLLVRVILAGGGGDGSDGRLESKLCDCVSSFRQHAVVEAAELSCLHTATLLVFGAESVYVEYVIIAGVILQGNDHLMNVREIWYDHVCHAALPWDQYRGRGVPRKGDGCATARLGSQFFF